MHQGQIKEEKQTIALYKYLKVPNPFSFIILLTNIGDNVWFKHGGVSLHLFLSLLSNFYAYNKT
jgi:hypothetical protein